MDEPIVEAVGKMTVAGLDRCQWADGQLGRAVQQTQNLLDLVEADINRRWSKAVYAAYQQEGWEIPR